MRRFIRSSAIVAAALLFGCAAQADLKSFMQKPEPAYSWKLEDTVHSDGVTIYKLHLVSQEWHGFKWEHDLALFRPDNPTHPEFCGLRNTGGHYGGDNVDVGRQLARYTGSSFAVLWGIPMQPIWDKTEDALIVATWQKFMETGDPTWPLHFPMAKAVVKAMDAIQEFSTKELKAPISKFVINGGSKRGWTTWLVAASQDPRVVAIAPMVIDTLNVSAQMPHQLAMLGKPSEQIADYSGSGMTAMMNTPRGKELMKLEDPYSYRDILTLPKLLLFGTNDRYWAQDALNFYWDDLKGPKWVLYTPNAGHNLDEKDDSPYQGRKRSLETFAHFLRCVADHKPMPQITWKHEGPSDAPTITVESNVAPASARIWRVESSTTDFRDSKWSSTEVPTHGRTQGTIPLQPAPAGAFAATYVELTFDADGKPFNLSTQIRILPKTK